jgi:proline iminopeptidase
MYPPIQPHKREWLRRDRLSTGQYVEIYVECSGNPKGVPVIYLHGGPGDHSIPRTRRYYDPKFYHIILFDQRGCGKSLPANHTEKNTTDYLIQDIECIREWIQVPSMVVSGGSWGSTLSLLYAQAHPARVDALLLRGVYDLTNDDVLDQMYPEQEDKLRKFIQLKPSEDEDAKIEKILSRKTKKRTALIRLMSDEPQMHVTTKTRRKEPFKESETLAIIGTHYGKHHHFASKRQLYKNMHKIKHIPTIMVEGRYDMVTPPKMAYTLSKIFTNCDLNMVPAGHSSTEREVTRALVKASNKLKQYFN